MKKGRGLSVAAHRALLKRAVVARRREREALFPKPCLVWVNAQVEDIGAKAKDTAYAARPAATASAEHALGRSTP